MTLELFGKVLPKHILVEAARYGQIDIECMQLQGDLEVHGSILVVVLGACEGDWVVTVVTRWWGFWLGADSWYPHSNSAEAGDGGNSG